jgi:hypothetical protein
MNNLQNWKVHRVRRNLNGVLIDLQMKLYLCVSVFFFFKEILHLYR